MKLNSIVIATLALTLTCMGLSGCSSREEREEKYIARAKALYEEGDFVKARLEARNVLQINPDNYQAHYLRAQMFNAERDAKVGPALKKTIELKPDFVPARLDFAEILFLYGPLADDQTIDHLNKVLEVEPDNTKAFLLLSKVQLRGENRDKSLEYVQKALETAPTSIEALAIMLELNKEQPDPALAAIDNALSLDPDSKDLVLLKIAAHKLKGDKEIVTSLYEQLISQNPDNLAYHQVYLNYLNEKGTPEQVEQLLEETIQRNPSDPQFKIWMAQLLVSSGKTDQAITLAKEYIEKEPGSLELHILLSNIYLSQGDIPAAERVLLDAIESGAQGPKSLDIQNRLANIALQSGDSIKARKYLDQVIEAEPRNNGALMMLAELAMKEGDAETAVLNLRTVVDQDPESFKASIALAQAHEANESIDLALDSYKNALELEPANTQLVLKIAQIYESRDDSDSVQVLLGRYLVTPTTAAAVAPTLVASFVKDEKWQQAFEVTTVLENQKENLPLAQYLKSGILHEKGDFEESQKELESLLSSAPGSSGVLSAIVNNISSSSGPESAIEYLENYVETHPDEISPHMFLASLHMQLGNADKALDEYQKVLASDSENLEARVAISQIHRDRGDIETALTTINEALAISPKNSGLLVLKAGLLEASSQYEAAAATYEAILQQDAANAIAINNLAMLLIDPLKTKENIARAMDITEPFESAEAPVLLDTRGWVHYRAGNYDRALALLESAIAKLEQVGAVYRYHLGMAYFKLDNNSRAKEELTAALAANEEFHGIEEATATLAKL